MRGPARLATYIAVFMTIAGFATIVLAWNGAASLDRATGQFPYLISGGLVGLGLIVAAMAILYLQTARQMTAERAREMGQINATLASAVEAARKGTFVPEAAVGVGAGSSTPAPGGSGPEWAADGVVAGKSSFHAPSCHLVAGRDDLETLARGEAEAAGLNPCRICKP